MTAWLSDPAHLLILITSLAAVLASIPAGIVGSWIVVNRISYTSASIAHAVLGGVGIAVYLRHLTGWEWLSPTVGGLLAGILSAWIISWITQRRQNQSDIAISLVWVVSMAIGIIAIHKTPGYQDPSAFLFGNILLANISDLWVIGGFGLLLLGIVSWKYRTLEILALDPEYAKLRGIPVLRYQTGTLTVVACSVVILLSTSGILLVIALMSIPPAALLAGASSLRILMIRSVGLTALISLGGLLLSWHLDWPTSACIVLLAALTYLLLPRLIHAR